ncbi:UNVERIFIED_CONTAM: hypothetical protein Sindi_2430100 [Sesamum indicum]
MKANGLRGICKLGKRSFWRTIWYLKANCKLARNANWFDAVAVSVEVEAEKPHPMIFLKACEFLEIQPEDAVHVGDDRRSNVRSARDAGCDAWLWGSDVKSFKEVAQRIGVQM